MSLKPKIASTIEWTKRNIGDGRHISFVWDRGGSPAISLLRRQEWKPMTVFGVTGHLKAKSPVPISGVSSAGLSYKIEGDDLIVTSDPITIEGYAESLNPMTIRKTQEKQPVGFAVVDDMVNAVTISSAAQWLIATLWPVADIGLPPQVAGFVMAKGDSLVIEFSSGPTLKMEEIITMTLSVTSIVVTQDAVTVNFNSIIPSCKRHVFKVE